MKTLFLTLLFCSLFAFPLTAQVVLTGKVTDHLGQPVARANVTVGKPRTGLITAYDISKDDGSYRIEVSTEGDSLQLDVRHIAHQPHSSLILNTSQTKNVQLAEGEMVLREVVVEREQLLTQRGDTLVFNLDAIKGKEDRVIADVIRRLPGVEVQENGAILYQGKPIVKYYIEGLDLLEGRYGLANNNLPADAVESVEILENHQPIRMLDSLVASDQAAVNIKLKAKITKTGTAKVGGGASPLLWETEIVPMFFTKNHQMIAGFKSNNVGEDVRNELRALTADQVAELISSKGGPRYPKSWLGVASLSPPMLRQNRWLDNEIALLTGNYITRMGKDFEFKVLTSYVRDRQQRIGSARSRFFTPTGEIELVEETERGDETNEAEVKFVLTKNVKKHYFKNETQFLRNWDGQSAALTQNGQALRQSLTKPHTLAYNKLRWMFPWGKKIVTFRSHNEYFSGPERLRLSPAAFPETFGISDSSGLQQHTHFSTFYTEQQLALSKPMKYFVLNADVGFSLQNQRLRSDLRPFQQGEGSGEAFGGLFQNDLNFLNSSTFANLSWEMQRGSWRIRLRTPVQWRYLRAEDGGIETVREINQPTFTPDLNITKEISGTLRAGITLAQNQEFGNIQQSYFGYLLSNYLSLRRNDAPLAETRIRKASAYISLRDPLNNLFLSGNYSFNTQRQNLLLSTTLDERGATLKEALLEDNTQFMHSFGGRASIYVQAIRSTFMLNGNYSLSETPLLLNGLRSEAQNQNLTLYGKIFATVNDWFGIKYHNQISFYRAFTNGQELTPSRLQSHRLLFNFFFTDWQYLGIEGELFRSDFAGQFGQNEFLNMRYHITFEKSKIDIELKAVNLLNTREFVSASADAFTFREDRFQLRPRQFWVTVGFRF